MLFADTGRPFPIAKEVRKYKPGTPIFDDVPADKTVEEQYGIYIATLVQLYEDNFKKPESERKGGLKLKFRYQDFENDNGGLDHFPINWDDLFDMLNMSELDASIIRCSAL